MLRLGRMKNKEFYVNYNIDTAKNRHMLFLGGSGNGKTYLVNKLLVQLRNESIPIIIIDHSSSYVDAKLIDELRKLEDDGEITRRLIYNEKLHINPLERKIVDIDNNLYETKELTLLRVADMFKKPLGLTELQRTRLFRAFQCVIKSSSEQLAFNDIFKRAVQYLEDSNDNADRAVASKLLPIVCEDIFAQSDDNFLEKAIRNRKFLIIDINAYPKEIKELITDFILWNLWNTIYRMEGENDPIILVLDEFQDLNCKEGGAISQILREGRKFNLGAWMITQSVVSLNKSGIVPLLEQVALKIFFQMGNKDINVFKNVFASKRIKDKLPNLPALECIVQGDISTPFDSFDKRDYALIEIGKGKDS